MRQQDVGKDYRGMAYISFGEYLRTVAGLSEPILQTVLQPTREVCFKRGDLLIEEGKVCGRIYFINSGIVRCCSCHDGNNLTRSFSMEGDNVLSTLSVIHHLPSVFSIEALEDVIVTEYTATDFRKTLMGSRELMGFTLNVLFACLNILEVGYSLHADRDAMSRYVCLQCPKARDMVERIPLKHIASYLGMSQATLSRVRHRFAHTEEVWPPDCPFSSGSFSVIVNEGRSLLDCRYACLKRNF